ncbi:MAG: DNA (cytosine-5-)-methyltransferase [Bacteroidales bacterium]|nr:DNA (cytosine-5-)-methyltransferase [Bacteroidales bacterium]
MDIGFLGNFKVATNGRVERYLTLNTEIVFANDIFKEARLAWIRYMATHTDKPAEHWDSVYSDRSIVDLVKDHRNGLEVFPTDIDILTGGFPCQDFSVAGKRRGFNSHKDDKGCLRTDKAPTEENRGMLYYWMKEAINIMRPKMFIAENVKGLMSLGDVKTIIQNDFASAGYVVLEPRVLHAADFGVPENRERVFFVGFRRDAVRPDTLRRFEKAVVPKPYLPYPEPTHAYTTNTPLLKLPVRVREVFEGLKEPDSTDDPSQKVFSRAKWRKNGQGQSEVNLSGIAPTIRSEHHGNIEFRRLSLEHGGKYADELENGMVERRLTPRECALIQSFPPDYEFVGKGISANNAYKMIGNAVPPLLAYRFADWIVKGWPLWFID